MKRVLVIAYRGDQRNVQTLTLEHDDLDLHTDFINISPIDNNTPVSLYEELVSDPFYDAVVVCDGVGDGLEAVKALNRCLLPRTIVFWNEYQVGMERPYVDLGLGLSKFCSRMDICKELKELVLLPEFMPATL